MSLARFSAVSGIIRAGVSESDAIKSGALTEHEKDVYRAVFYNGTMTKPMRNEASCIKASAALTAAEGYPQLPMLIFCSDGKGTGFSREDWQKIQGDFAEESGADIVYLDCSHYVHNYEQERIAQKVKAWIDEVK